MLASEEGLRREQKGDNLMAGAGQEGPWSIRHIAGTVDEVMAPELREVQRKESGSQNQLLWEGKWSSPADTLTLTQGDLFWTNTLYDYKIDLCKSSDLWWFTTGAIRNQFNSLKACRLGSWFRLLSCIPPCSQMVWLHTSYTCPLGHLGHSCHLSEPQLSSVKGSS